MEAEEETAPDEKTAPEEVAKREPVEERFPAKFVTIKQMHERKIAVRQRRCDLKTKEAQKGMTEHNEKFSKASEDLRDFLDQEYLRTGRDPEKASRGERHPRDVVKHHLLVTALNGAVKAMNDAGSKVDGELLASGSFKDFDKTKEHYDTWLEKVCLHYNCAPCDLDWEKCLVKVYPVDKSIPDDLFELPQEEGADGSCKPQADDS